MLILSSSLMGIVEFRWTTKWFFVIVLFILQFYRMEDEKCIDHCCMLLPRVNRLIEVIFKTFNDREEKNSIVQSYFLKEELSVFMTRCCRRKNKGLFIGLNRQIIRLDFYGIALTCFESINSKSRKERKTCPSDKVDSRVGRIIIACCSRHDE